jgi:uncharacterized protein YjbI with pentapeptide repeats
MFPFSHKNKKNVTKKEYKIITDEQLKGILANHNKWIKSWRDPERDENNRADLSHVDLREFNLKGIDLTGANLFEANLEGSDLSRIKLHGAGTCSRGPLGPRVLEDVRR